MTVQDEIISKIEAAPTIIIHRHQRPDPDAVGSQAGLAIILRASFPDKQVYQVGQDVHSLDWIAKEQTVDDAVYQHALVIVLDTANAPRVDDARYTTGADLIKIDHHPAEDQYAPLNWVVPEASSTSELVVDLVTASHGKLHLTPEAARMLYAGIVGDTGRFMYDNTTPHTLEVVAELFRQGIDAPAVNRKLSDISLPEARLAAFVYQNMEITEHHAAFVVIKLEDIERLGIKDAGTSSAVSLPGMIADVLCWTVIVEQRDGTYRLRIRSKAPVINELAKKHDGGGHPLASGAVLHDEEQIPDYVAELDALAAKYEEEHQ